jgi:hypothetical protein
MQDTTNRTFICSVAFVDLVGYSKKLVSEQVQCKDRFNFALSEAIKETPVADRIVLDTGDGAAISFLGDPEDALFVTLALRDQYAKLRADFPEDAIRMGINLGPVKLVKDINGQPNIIGDGINVAQRIMSFARPAQILVSRSYHEAVSRISGEYAKLFLFEGSKTDKHVREHEVYLVGDSAEAISKIREGVADRSASTGGVGDKTLVLPKPGAGRGLKIAAAGALALVAALGVGVVLKSRTAPVAPPVVAKAPDPTPAPGSTSPSGTNPSGSPSGTGVTATAPTPTQSTSPTPTDPTKPVEAPKPDTKPADPAPADPAKPVEPPKVDPKLDPTKALDPSKPPEKKTDGRFDAKSQGQLIVVVKPWGNILINGRQAGIAPGNTRFNLKPGKYKVEFTNSASPTPYVENIEIKAGETVRLSHEFK